MNPIAKMKLFDILIKYRRKLREDFLVRKKKMLKIIIIVIVLVIVVVLGLLVYGKYQMNKIPELSFQEALEYTTKNNEEAIITVGIIKDGQMTYTVYGENGKELPKELHTYEIGSLTKTFTAAMICKGIQENKIQIDDTIDKYLSLPEGKSYPTIKELLTHTSGYKAYYFESPMISNFLRRKNDFCGITRDMVAKKVASVELSNKEYSFNYSNYGYAVLGLVLEEIYQKDYTTIMNEFVQTELQLQKTKVSDGKGDLSNYWDWEENDAYLSAGALISDIEDMLAYAQMQMDNSQYFGQCHNSIKEINATTEAYKMMGIHMDEIGMAWIIDKENNIVWHNGGTGNYNCYLGFNVESETAVIVLSNLSPSYRIPATVLGVKLLQSMN